MDRYLGWIIRRVKVNPDYHIHPGLSAGDLLREFAWRGTCGLRGILRLAGVPGGRLRFVEPGCRIRHKRHLSIGKGSVIESYAQLHCLSRDGVHIGERVTIGKFAMIKCTAVLWQQGAGLVVGDDSNIGDYSFVGCAGGVKIGARVLMGPRVAFHSQNHNFSDLGSSIKAQGVNEKGIVIGEDCWIGSGAIILDGVNLGRGCVVAAGAVVASSFPDNSMVAGVPAKYVRERSKPSA